MTKSIGYKIFFHNDVDGIITAAMFLNCFVHDKYVLCPVKSSARGEKFDKIVKDVAESDGDIAVVLDYQYSEHADIWIDHHWNSQFGDSPIANNTMLYDPTAKSAARVLCNNIFAYELMVPEKVIKMTDIIDVAGYPSVEFIFESKDPLMILRAYTEQITPLNVTYSRIVETIVSSGFDFEKVLYRLELNDSIIEKLKDSALQTKRDMVISGNFSIIRQNRVNKYPRHSEYFIKPELKYSMRFTRMGGDRVKLSIGYNKWCGQPNEINIGKMISYIDYKIVGGGHFNVASAMLYEKDVETLIDDISGRLNGDEGDTMEKYGVDKAEDKVEKKAQEMVKTGKAVDIDKAREKAIDAKGEQTKDVQGVDE